MICIKGCGRKATRRRMCHACYEKRRTRDTAYGRWQSTFVDAEPARRHVLALRAAGMGRRRLAELSGVSDSAIHVLINGRPGRGTGPSKRIASRNAKAILAVPMPDTRHLAAGALVDITGTTRRLRALVAIGYTQSRLCGLIGITPANGTALFTGSRGRVLAATAHKVASLYDAMSMRPGPSEAARNRARRLRWAPPLAWDDDTIDDPEAKPDAGASLSVTWVDRYQELRDLGLSDRDIMARWNIQPQSLIRQLDRYGIPHSPELTQFMRDRMRGRAS